MNAKLIIIAWIILAALLFVPPRTPPSAPAGVGLVNGAPYYAHEPVSFEERFSPEAIGPTAHQPGCQCMDCFPYVSPLGDHAYFEARSIGCEVSRAAVTAQGVGE